MKRAAPALLLLCGLAAGGRREIPAPIPGARGVLLLPEEAWLYARTADGVWSAEMEEDTVYTVPATDELKIRITVLLSEFRVRLVDERGNTVPARAGLAAPDPAGQVHTLGFERPLAAGAYRIVIDAPLGGVLRDSDGGRRRGQRFRIVVPQ